MDLQTYGIKPSSLRPLPEFFQLKNDEFGRNVISSVNSRFNYRSEFWEIRDTADKPVVCYNPFGRIALGETVRDWLGKDVNLLTPATSELALRFSGLRDLTAVNENLGIVVYCTDKGWDQRLAIHLIEQAKASGIDVEFPMVFYNLNVVKDDKFDGFRLDFADNGVAYHVPILKEGTGYFSPHDVGLVKTGFPSKLKTRGRKFNNFPAGIGWIYRGADSRLHVQTSFHQNPDSYTHVTFMKGEISQPLEDLVIGLETERQRQLEAAEGRYQKAMKVMGG